ncbi:hypothetical protein, partial [Pseudomonas fluorescens]|uniref:hypothetical protein n=1 Tax=Pseudomonas fluorescens TaxID=294 RepID=UPI001CD6F918
AGQGNEHGQWVGCAGCNQPANPAQAGWRSCLGMLVWVSGAVYLEQPFDPFVVNTRFPDLALAAESIDLLTKN